MFYFVFNFYEVMYMYVLFVNMMLLEGNDLFNGCLIVMRLWGNFFISKIYIYNLLFFNLLLL